MSLWPGCERSSKADSCLLLNYDMMLIQFKQIYNILMTVALNVIYNTLLHRIVSLFKH